MYICKYVTISFPSWLQSLVLDFSCIQNVVAFKHFISDFVFSITLEFCLRKFHIHPRCFSFVVSFPFIALVNHVLHTQAPTVFVNHVIPFQHTDTGRHTDFRRKVTPEIGVTIQNSQHLAHKAQMSPKLTLEQLRVEIT